MHLFITNKIASCHGPRKIRMAWAGKNFVGHLLAMPFCALELAPITVKV